MPKPKRRARELPLDTELLSEVVIELNISRKKVAIYPRGHAQITKSIDQAHKILLKLFTLRSEMTLGVAKDTLMVGQDYLDPRNQVYRDFASSLNQRDIAAVTFISGLTREELVKFHGILATKPEDIRAGGGIDRVITQADVPHIRIHALDYSNFHVTEEQEIFKMPPGGAARGTLWQDFISHLSAGTLAGPEGGVSLKEAEQADPAELARLLNERKLDRGASLRSYDEIISHHVLERASRRELLQEQSTAMANMNKMIQDLHPELRKQFLSVAFQRISSHTNSGVAEEIVGDFSDNLVIEMLKQASDEGREISPSLVGLLGKLTGAKAPHGEIEGSPSGEAGMPPLPIGSVEELFSREKYENYVTEDYDVMLKRLSEKVPVASEPFPLTEYTKTFAEEHLDFQIGSALLAFLEEDLDEEDYREFTGKLVVIMPGLLRSGNFDLLREIHETLGRHSTEKPVTGIREIALETHRVFSGPQFISHVLNAFEMWMQEREQSAAGLIQSLGPATVPGLLDLLEASQDKNERVRIIHAVLRIGAHALPAVVSRIAENGPWFVLRNLSYILGRLGCAIETKHFIPLLLNKNKKVQAEALNSIQRIGGRAQTKTLLSVLPDADDELRLKIVEILGVIRATEAVPALVTMIKSKGIVESHVKADIDAAICTTLGKICAREALPVLAEIARPRGILTSLTSHAYSKKVQNAASRAVATIERGRPQG